MHYSFFSRVAVLSVFLASGVLTADGRSETKDVSVNGYSFWQIGQIVRGNGSFDYPQYNIPDPMPRQWTNNVLIGLRIEAQPSERLHLVISPEFNLNYPYPEMPQRPETKRPFGNSSINEANGVFSFGDLDKPFMEATLGMFVYKYNPDAHHLGEYLFRTGTFPTYIVTDFDFPAARLCGLHLSSNAIHNLQCDVLFTSEAFMFPLYDFSLSGIASYRLFNMIEIGAGVDFARVLPTSIEKTSPRLNNPSFDNIYMTSDGDTSNSYTFQAAKVMGRVSIDPKVLFPSLEIFGKEDLKLYAEVVAVGVDKNYHAIDTIIGDTRYFAYYNDLNARTPRLLGFNIPAFKLLDVLSMEWEYFPSLVPNDYYDELWNMSPVPHVAAADYDPNTYKCGWWRWSFYAKKQILNGFSMAGLVAFDHLRTTYWDGSPQTYEFMTKKGNWHWNLKFGYSF